MLNCTETLAIIFVLSASIYTSSGAPVTCDPVATQQCLNEFLRDLDRTDFSHSRANNLVSEICNTSYPNYLQCIQPKISSCNPPIDFQNIYVKGVEYVCSANKSAQTEGLTCLAEPQVAQGIQSCNAKIPEHTSDFCRIRNEYIACVSGITASYCTPVGYFVVRDYLLYSFKSTSDIYKCEEVMSSLPTTTTTTPSSNVFSTIVPVTGTPDDCGRECLKFFSSPLIFGEAMLNGTFTLALLTEACSNFTRYEQCMKQNDCDPNTVGHSTLWDLFRYVCGSGYQEITSQRSCWEKGEVKQMWKSYLYVSAGHGDLCSSVRAQTSFLKSEIAQHCDAVALDVVMSVHNALTHPIVMDFNCTFPTTPHTEPEVTEHKPDPEVTETQVTSEKEPGVTELPIQVSKGTPDDCGRECLKFFSSPLIFGEALLKGNFTPTLLTEACSNFTRYEQCMKQNDCDPNTVGHSTLWDLFRYVCGSGYQDIISQRSCWEKVEVKQMWKSCLSAGHGDICSSTIAQTSCLRSEIARHCDAVAVNIVSELVYALTYSTLKVYNCTFPTTPLTDPKVTEPKSEPEVTENPATTESKSKLAGVPDQASKVPFRCYDCHSGGGSWQKPDCTQDGSIADWAVNSCEDSCFAKTNKWNKDVIYRGCAGKYLPVDHPRPLPRSGCHKIKGEVWCFCEGDKCNVMSVEDYLP